MGYGLPALVGLSRIIDQQHWPSDVVMGTLVGTLIGHLATPSTSRRTASRAGERTRFAIRPLPVLAADPSGARVLQLAFAGRL